MRRITCFALAMLGLSVIPGGVPVARAIDFADPTFYEIAGGVGHASILGQSLALPETIALDYQTATESVSVITATHAMGPFIDIQVSTSGNDPDAGGSATINYGAGVARRNPNAPITPIRVRVNIAASLNTLVTA